MSPVGQQSTEPTARRLSTGRLCLELVATVHGRLSERSRDDLRDRAGLTAWLGELGVASPSATAELDGFLAIREAVYRLATSAATGEHQSSAQRDRDIALINEHARGDVPVPRMRTRKSGGEVQLVLDVPRPTSQQVLALVARDAIDLLTGPDHDLLCQCQASTCGTLYVDSSRGRRRRWCSSESCGNRARVAAHRQRTPTA